MTCASTTNNFLLTNLDCAQLIHMPSQFTSSEAKFFRDLFEQLINFNISKIILDFGETNFISSEGLVSLCQILKQARDTKINLTFSRFSPQMKIVLSLVGLEDIFPVETELFVRKQN